MAQAQPDDVDNQATSQLVCVWIEKISPFRGKSTRINNYLSDIVRTWPAY